MEHVTQLAEKAVQNASQGIPAEHTVEPLPAKLIDRLFVRFQSMFGHKFSGQFGDDKAIDAAKAEWGKALSSLSIDDITRGLDYLIESGKEWPPAIPEFKSMCREKEPEIVPPYHAAYRPDRALVDESARAKRKVRNLTNLRGCMAILEGAK